MLYVENYRRACAAALREGAGADAEDIVQRAAMLAMDRLHEFEAGSDFGAWLCALVRGLCKNHRRGEARRAARDLRAQERRESFMDDAARGYRDVEVPDDAFRNALDSLGPLQKTCFLLRTVMGHSYAEIANVLEVPEATARSHVYRSRRLLHEALRRYGEPGDPREEGRHG